MQQSTVEYNNVLLLWMVLLCNPVAAIAISISFIIMSHVFCNPSFISVLKYVKIASFE